MELGSIAQEMTQETGKMVKGFIDKRTGKAIGIRNECKKAIKKQEEKFPSPLITLPLVYSSWSWIIVMHKDKKLLQQ